MTQPPSRATHTKAALLAAARRLFAQRGFDLIGVRDVAADAGVNAALVIRYFGSKEALFLQALTTPDPTSALLDGPLHDLGARLAHYALSKPDARSSVDAAALRLQRTGRDAPAAGDRRAVHRPAQRAPAWRRPAGARALIAADILGLSVLSKMIGTPREQRDLAQLERESARSLQRLIDGDKR